MKKIVQSAYNKDFLEEVDLKADAKTDMREPEDDEEADFRFYPRLSGEPMYLL